MPLSDRHRKVINAYMINPNKEEAMLAGGYSATTAKSKQNTVFGREDIQSEIKRRQSLISHKTDVTLEWCVKQLKKIAEADITDIIEIDEKGVGTYNLNKLTPELRAALTGYSVDEIKSGRGADAADVQRVRVQFQDRVRVLELLIRHLGLSKEKQAVEISGSKGLVELLQQGRSRVGIGGDELEEDK